MCKSDAFNDEIGNDHIGTSDHTPLRADAFDRTDDEKIELIQKNVEDILNTLNYSKNNTDKLVLNFTSCYLDNEFPPTYAGKAARLINPWLIKQIDNNDKLGIIVADFITLELAQSIYMRNIV